MGDEAPGSGARRPDGQRRSRGAVQPLHPVQGDQPLISRLKNGQGRADALSAQVQPLYTSGRVTWSVRARRARTEAGVQKPVRRAGAGAAGRGDPDADVLQAQEVRRVRRADLEPLTRQRDETQARFTGGLVTRTDVAQAQLDAAARRCRRPRARWSPPPRSSPPPSVARRASSSPPTWWRRSQPPWTPPLIARKPPRPLVAEPGHGARLEAAARLARANQGPSVALQGALGYVGPVSPLAPRDYDRAVTAQLVLTQPLLTGGLLSSLTRQARDRARSDRLTVEALRRQVMRETAQAWSALLAARDAATASTAQVRAAELALAGAQAEYGFALRTSSTCSSPTKRCGPPSCPRAEPPR